MAAVPAVLIGLLIRAWVIRSPLMALNSDEALTGLQTLEVLRGHFRLFVAGNDYGSTTESYLFAPLLAVWTGVWPLRIGSVVLSVGCAYALFRLARPLLGRTAALTVALVGWTASAGVVIVFSRPYMGYATGFMAQVAALALACHAMRSTQRLAGTALLAGFAAGFAIWSHPMFGVVSLLALIAPTLYRWRFLGRWWVPLALGGLLGASPWLAFLVQEGLPTPSERYLDTSYPHRVLLFFTELMPRMFGLKAPDGGWVGPPALAITLVALLVAGAFAGMVLLVVKRGRQAVPVLVTGVLAFPALAVFTQLTFFADARYALPFLPAMLVGLGGLSLLLPQRARESARMVVWVPVVWSLALCVPVIHKQIGWTISNPDLGAQQAVAELRDRGVQYLAGDYWGVYLFDYLADDSLTVRPDAPIRLEAEAAAVDAADRSEVAYVYGAGSDPRGLPRGTEYQQLSVGGYDLYLPRPAG